MTFDPQKLQALAVSLHGRRAGVITRLPGDKQLFTLDEAYAQDPARPTLSLSFKSQTGGLMTAVRPVRRRLPPFFCNLLPEGHLRTYLAEQAGVNPEREFFLLASLGADLAGAATIAPLDHRDNTRAPADAAAADDDLTAGGTIAEGRRPSGAPIFPGRVQLKFSAVMESSGGLIIPAQGVGGSWIVKLPSLRFAAVAANEFAMLELARAIGIAVPRIQLVPVKRIEGLPPEAARLEGNALTVERFDRTPEGRRVHMEDFAQVFGILPENKYKSVSYSNIARVLRAETGEQGTTEFVRRLVFSVLIGNGDMHLKNWSLLYPDARTPVLSPAYDFVSTVPYIPGDRLALTFGESRALEEITWEQIRRFVDKAGMPMSSTLRTVADTVEATVAAWQSLGPKDILPADIRGAIDAQINRAAARTATALTGRH